MTSPELSTALQSALLLESKREYAAAAQALDRALERHPYAPAPLRFQALLLRADLAIALDDLGESRGILAEAKQMPLSPSDRESLSADLRRADDLETFLTHRGCAG